MSTLDFESVTLLRETKEALQKKIETVWGMAAFYVEQRDSHGVMDMGAELQALERSLKTLTGLKL